MMDELLAACKSSSCNILAPFKAGAPKLIKLFVFCIELAGTNLRKLAKRRVVEEKMTQPGIGRGRWISIPRQIISVPDT